MSVEKALKGQIVLLIGDEEVLRRRALDELLKSLNMAADDFDIEHFDAGSSRLEAWVASCATAPFMADRRVAVVRRLLKMSPGDERTALLKTLPPTALLILVADDEVSATEGGSSRFKTNGTQWEKVIKTAGGTTLEFKRDPKKAKEAVRAEAQRLGLQISSGTLDMLVEMTGSSASRAFGEIEKLAISAGAKGSVSESDLRRQVVPSREWSIFSLVDAVASGKPAEALRQLKILTSGTSKVDEAAFRSIMPMVGRQLRLLWQARTCLDARCTPENPTAAVKATFPSQPDISSVTSYVAQKTMQAAQRLDHQRIALCLGVLSDTDARMKGFLPAISHTDTLERMVIEMCAAVQSK